MRWGGHTIALLAMVSACSEQPKRDSRAVIVDIAQHPNPKYHPDEVLVTARSMNGEMGSKPVPLARLSCRKGDMVQGSVQGLKFTFDDRACRR